MTAYEVEGWLLEKSPFFWADEGPRDRVAKESKLDIDVCYQRGAPERRRLLFRDAVWIQNSEFSLEPINWIDIIWFSMDQFINCTHRLSEITRLVEVKFPIIDILTLSNLV